MSIKIKSENSNQLKEVKFKDDNTFTVEGTSGIILNNPGILVWNLAEFDSNATNILPKGTKVYYQTSSNKITGIYKIGDGISNVEDLPIQYEMWNYADYKSNNFPNTSERFGYFYDTSNSYIKTRLGDAGSSNYTIPINTIRFNSFLLLHPVFAISYTVNISTFSAAGPLRIALYKINSNGIADLVTGTDITVNITAAGIQTFIMSSSPLLEPGIYLYAYWRGASGTFTLRGYNTNINYIFKMNGDRSNYATTTSSTFPVPNFNFETNGTLSATEFEFRLNFINAI